MNTTTRAKRAAMAASLAMLTAGGVLAMGNEPAAAACPHKFDRLGGYHRVHFWCANTYVKVSVACRIGTVHTSSYYRWGYNKAQCHEGSEGIIVSKRYHTCKSCKRG
ncbi:hypothetical protein [Taklimakanibacter deserti]|uniref:hypothetical protein n=1 Tax=Taklimakanibacter deserti TaxID=2267839 RepID=UPI000E65D789